jgi:hypothetical protein
MVMSIQVENKLIGGAQSVIDWTSKVLKDDKLTATQREDLEAIKASATCFLEYASSKIEIIRSGASPEETQRVRHDLRNHLNIINGFSRIFVKELPDNLLLHMMSIRNINATSQEMIEQVDSIR